MKTQVTRMVAGTRGGLGRILLTAFMLLAIVPLSVVSYLAIRQVQQVARQTARSQLNLVADSSALQILAWLDGLHSNLLLLANSSVVQQAVQGDEWSDICSSFSHIYASKFAGLGDKAVAPGIADVGGGVRFAFIAVIVRNQPAAVCSLTRPGAFPHLSERWSEWPQSLLISAPLDGADAVLVGYPDLQALERLLVPLLVQDGKQGFLLDQDARVVWCLSAQCSHVTNQAIDLPGVDMGSMQGVQTYQDALGRPMVGAYRGLENWPLAFWVEQPQETVFTRQEELATILIASTLAVALLTTLLAAVITRQLTSPIVDLAVSAVKIAGGDLSQVVEVRRRDEIGILGRAFNVMTAELRSLYEGLEQKVVERTLQLTEANRQLRYQAMQLALSAEIGRVATSILDLDELLAQVTHLILDSYAYVYDASHVAVFLQDEFGEWLDLHTSQGNTPYPGPRRVAVGGDSLVGQVARDGQTCVERADGRCPSQVVIPLRIGARTIGVLELRGRCGENVVQQDVGALESLSDQLSVAIENARVYAAEHEAVERLSRLDHVRLASLSAGSRELATFLNNIIGFSGLMLKGVDGPLTDLQRTDLVAIHKSGYQLLGLIDNVITLSELESDGVQPDLQPVDIVELIEQVLVMAQQRFIDVTFEWQRKPEAEALVCGDAGLLQQAFLGLATAAAEQVSVGAIAVEVFACEQGAWVVGVGSIGWSARDVEVKGALAVDTPSEHLGEDNVGLLLGKEVIALHQGTMWSEFHPVRGWRGVAVLPSYSGVC